MKIEFTIPGVPVGKGRPRVTAHTTFTPKKTAEYEKKVRECWREQSGVRVPDNTPMKITVRAYFPPPSSYSKRKRLAMIGRPHDKRPDIDNVIKCLMDAIQDRKNRKTGTVTQNAFKDDSSIYMIVATKQYSSAPRLNVIIEYYPEKEK